MKLFKKVLLLLFVLWVFYGIKSSISCFQDKTSFSSQVKSQQQELSPETDMKIKYISEKAATIFVHTIFAPFEKIINESDQNPEYVNNQPLVIDKSWLIPPQINKPSIEERMKILNDKVKSER